MSTHRSRAANEKSGAFSSGYRAESLGGGGKRAIMRQKREDKEKIKCFMKGADQSVGTTDE